MLLLFNTFIIKKTACFNIEDHNSHRRLIIILQMLSHKHLIMLVNIHYDWIIACVKWIVNITYFVYTDMLKSLAEAMTEKRRELSTYTDWANKKQPRNVCFSKSSTDLSQIFRIYMWVFTNHILHIYWNNCMIWFNTFKG